MQRKKNSPVNWRGRNTAKLMLMSVSALSASTGQSPADGLQGQHYSSLNKTNYKVENYCDVYNSVR